MTRIVYEGDGSKQRYAVRAFASDLAAISRTLEAVAMGMSMNLDMIDWQELRTVIDEKFDPLFDILGIVEEDDALDVIEGEEEVLHPLDPDDEDDEWHEGFDDA